MGLLRYRVAVNIEWTSKCNARCSMCPRSMISDPRTMELDTFRQVLKRLSPDRVYRAIIAGYGEPTTHPQFDAFAELICGHPVRFDMATNGSYLDVGRLARLDGLLHTLMISFSSVVPEVYRAVHTNLDRNRVMANILDARRTLKRTRLLINLSPTAECLDTLPETVSWFRANDIHDLHMSPTYYDRAGAMDTTGHPSERRLREQIKAFNLSSQEVGFIPSVGDIARQWLANRFKCIPRNTSLMIDARGNYTFCFNDIRHIQAIGNVAAMKMEDALNVRERTVPNPAICDQCNLRGRYRPRELVRVAASYAKSRLATA